MAKLEYLVGPSDGDDWIAFGEAAWRIEERLNVSVGHSQVTLRNLCASGEVRSVRIEYDIDPSDDPDATPVEVKMVRPSEWRTTEVDLDGVIEVSEGDLEYWLREQPRVSVNSCHGRNGSRPWSERRLLSCGRMTFPRTL